MEPTNWTVALVCALLVPVAAVAACSNGGAVPRYAHALTIDTSAVPRFSAENAHALLRQQVAFGPRVPGMPGHAAQLEWMTSYLNERADSVVQQPFTHVARNGATLHMTNVFARFRPELTTRVLLLAHWDTRPTADMDDTRQDQPIPGANDGASGVAVLLELANTLSQHPPPIGVDILLVDGEDYGPGEADMYLGAKYFAANLPAGYRPLYGILLDMVGDSDPLFPVEGNSLRYAPEVVDRVWYVAEQIGLADLFPRRVGSHVTDDHIPLNQAGIRTINIIDFEYGPGNAYWHTHEDDVRNTSPVGLGAVGRVVATLIYSGG